MNALLARLPSSEQQQLASKLTRVYLQHTAVLLENGANIPYVYFPETLLISLVKEMKSGKSAEVSVIGREGFAGVPLALGLQRTHVRWSVQVPGEALRLGAEDFVQALEGSQALSKSVRGYIAAYIDQITQTAACNSLHVVEQRLARWLLNVRDAVGYDDFDLTQEFLADMLGVRRATITEIALRFQAEGAIHYQRGHVTISNPEMLESYVCECRDAIRSRFQSAGLR